MTPVADLIDRLVSLHGEGGICPTAGDWRSIFETAADGPVTLLNLLALTPTVTTPDGPISGRDAYRRYTAGNQGPFTRAGGTMLFFGPVRHMFGLYDQPGDLPDWDIAVLTRYPSAHALAEMWLDQEFVAAHRNRVDGVERSQVLVFGG